MHLAHEFDWKGFSFFIKSAALLGFVIAVMPSGVATAYTYFTPGASSDDQVARAGAVGAERELADLPARAIARAIIPEQGAAAIR